MTWPYFSRPPEKLEVDKVCPNCSRGAPWWIVQQPLGETPGHPEGGPRMGSGVQMRCRFCSYEAVYREPAPDMIPGPPPEATIL